jgi:hypothetical protein
MDMSGLDGVPSGRRDRRLDAPAWRWLFALRGGSLPRRRQAGPGVSITSGPPVPPRRWQVRTPFNRMTATRSGGRSADIHERHAVLTLGSDIAAGRTDCRWAWVVPDTAARPGIGLHAFAALDGPLRQDVETCRQADARGRDPIRRRTPTAKNVTAEDLPA